MTNGPTYTEAVLEFTNMLTESERRQTAHNIEVMEQLGRGDEKFKAQEKRIDKNDDRLDDHDDDLKEVRKTQKWLGLGEGGMALLLAWLGFR